jgi:hypothetical protein
MNVAQRETLGWRGRHEGLSPVGTTEVSAVPAGLGTLIASPTPALRAGLWSGRPSGTASTRNTCSSLRDVPVLCPGVARANADSVVGCSSYPALRLAVARGAGL